MAAPEGAQVLIEDTTKTSRASPVAHAPPTSSCEDGGASEPRSTMLQEIISNLEENGSSNLTKYVISNMATDDTLQDTVLFDNYIKNEMDLIPEGKNNTNFSDLMPDVNSSKYHQIEDATKKFDPNESQKEANEIINMETNLKISNCLHTITACSDPDSEDKLSNHVGITNLITSKVNDNYAKICPSEEFGTASLTKSILEHARPKMESLQKRLENSLKMQIKNEHTDLKNASNDLSEIEPNCALIGSTQVLQSNESEPSTNTSVKTILRSDSDIFTIDSDTNILSNEEFPTHVCENTENSACTLFHEAENMGLINNVSLNSEHSRSIARSSLSLNDYVTHRGRAINRSPLSKSAENLFNTMGSSTREATNFSSSSLDGAETIDQDKILADFDSHKSKVPLLTKIPEIIAQDRFPRSHKEIITQDFGSIVKNVHGIFWSVSGSLKNAYNISQRNAVQNRQINASNIVVMGPLASAAIGGSSHSNSGDQVDADITGLNHQATLSIQNSPKMNEKGTSRPDAEPTRPDSQAREDGKLQCLERALLAERLEMAALRERTRQQAEELSEKGKLNKEMENKMELLRRRLETAEREKDAAVMRYAVSERAVIGARESAESGRRGERAARAEADLLAGKLKSAQAEKQRICQIYDDKCHELSTSERELARLREELRERDGKLKWTQGRLRAELDAYKEAAASAERLTRQVAELQAREADASDPARTKQLESDLKEAQASLILCRHESAELERRAAAGAQQLDGCRRELAVAAAAVERLEGQVEELGASNLRLEEEAAELASLRARAALADTLAAQLQRETERATAAEEETSRERARAETCARREAAALEHAARLTAEHVGERAHHQRLEDKARALAADNASLREKVSSLEVELTELTHSLAGEGAKRRKECQLLARKVAELTEELQQASKQLEWETGENSVLRKRHASAVKELNRELQRALKRSEQLEARGAQAEPPEASARTGSVSSLSSCEGPRAEGAGAGARAPAGEETLVNGHARPEPVPEIQVREPERQALIERIVQLQRAGARRAERCDFLEEHNRQLTAELSKKARLLRRLLASQPAGALAGQTSDDNKREMARLGGGAMAAVWGGAADHLTPELSLEINRKLQAVLEDALLKNITLKENMDTLGAEIARLKAAGGGAAAGAT